MSTVGETRRPAAAPGERYTPGDVEPKWQRRWDESGVHLTKDRADGKENWFALTMFPYPSGDLHIGHWFAFTGGDVGARFKRMQGYNVLHPQGFDAFGLPAENAAISRNVHPRRWTFDHISKMRKQFDLMGNSYDWSREVITCDPEYYRWNQYFFIKFYEAGLAYRAEGTANWCPQDQTTLANEQVKDGQCERCEAEVERRELPQWFFRITKYADELLEMDEIDWPEKIKVMQTNWIGRSEGVTIAFDAGEFASGEKIETFTTRIDTIYGVTFVVLAPEHRLVDALTQPEQRAEVSEYVAQARRESEIERTSTEREKTGVFTGAYCVNPLNGERVPVLVGDYVLASYGTGAVMGVPAHDTRDFIFAKKYGLPVRVVVAPDGWQGEELEEAYLGEGRQVNSGEFDGLPSAEGMGRIADKIEANGWGRRDVTYHLRDWLISRQRYWGTPIPMLYCDDCGTVPVPEDSLPVLLPEEADFRPTGQSPLTLDPDFVNTGCPRCGGPAKRETDTMDTFMDSSWYHLRFMSPADGPQPFQVAGTRAWGAGAPVHRRHGTRRDASAVRPLLQQGAAGHGVRGLRRTVQAAVQPRRHDHPDGPHIEAQQPAGARPARCPLRRRHHPLLPDVPGPLGRGRRMDRLRHQRHIPLAEPDVGPGTTRPRKASVVGARRRGRARPAAGGARHDPQGDRRDGSFQVQHLHRSPHGVLERPGEAVGPRRRIAGRMEGRSRTAAAAGRAAGAAHHGGAVGADGP